MYATYNEMVASPGKLESEAPMVAFLFEHSELAEEGVGDVEAPTGYFQRFGRWILTENSQGFVRGQRFDTADEASEQFGLMEDEYRAWADPSIWDLLEQSTPDNCDAVQDLYAWSLNYDPGKGPFTLFLDLIGYSEDELGETLYNLTSASLGYLELDKLADALKQYADQPHDVRAYVDVLMQAEANQ